jgi:hypothetical protein
MPYLIVRKTDGERTVIPYLTPEAARSGLDGMRTSLSVNGWQVVHEEPARSLVARSGDIIATVQVRHGFPPENAYVQTIPPVSSQPATSTPSWLRHGRMVAVAAVALVLSLGAVGGLGARQLELAFAADKEHEFKGFVEAMPTNGFLGDWQVAGRTVRVTELTQIDQKDALVALGARVEVEGRLLADGSIEASEIEGE